MKRAGPSRTDLSDFVDTSSSAEPPEWTKKKKKRRGRSRNDTEDTGRSEEMASETRTIGRDRKGHDTVSNLIPITDKSDYRGDRNKANEPKKFIDISTCKKGRNIAAPTTCLTETNDHEERDPKICETRNNKLMKSSNPNGVVAFFVVGKGNLDPYQVRNDLEHILNRRPVNITAERGIVKVEYRNADEQEKLERLTSLAGREVHVRKSFEPSEHLAQLIIFDVPLSLSTETIKECSRSIIVHRIERKVGEEKHPTTSVVLSYRKGDIPTEVKIEYLVFKTRPYVRGPVRCYNCQIFGHVAKHCFRPARCSRCCGDHDTRKCASPLHTSEQRKCASCNSENHNTGHKDCPSRIRAATIARTVAHEGITYAQAAQGFNNQQKNQNTETHNNPTKTPEQNIIVRPRQEDNDRESKSRPNSAKADEQEERIIETAKEIMRDTTNHILILQANIASRIKDMIRTMVVATTAAIDACKMSLGENEKGEYSAHIGRISESLDQLQVIIDEIEKEVSGQNRGDEDEDEYEDEGIDKYEIEEEEAEIKEQDEDDADDKDQRNQER